MDLVWNLTSLEFNAYPTTECNRVIFGDRSTIEGSIWFTCCLCFGSVFPSLSLTTRIPMNYPFMLHSNDGATSGLTKENKLGAKIDKKIGLVQELITTL